MKKIFSVCLIFTLITCPAFAAKPNPLPTSKPLSVREVADAQMFRYGRELYRKGDFVGAAQVFTRVLQIDCRNKLAQYHLQKIAQKGASFQHVAETLKSLPCDQYDFDEEDFLPAALYYEKDADLVLAQLSIYNARYRSAKAEITSQLEQYKGMISELETKADDLASALNSAEKTAAQAADLQQQLEASRALSARLEKESATLKAQMDASRTAYEKEMTDLEVKINQAGSSASQEKARQDLADKKAEMSRKALELMTLEEKFASLQERLAQIEAALVSKNQDIQTLEKDFSTLGK